MNLISLARVLEVETKTGTFEFSTGIVACPESMRGVLYCFSAPEKFTSAEPSEDSVRGFWEFHGRDAQTVSEITVPDYWPENPEVGISILYESNKKHGGGDGKKNLFRHKFSRGCRVYLAGNWLKIENPRMYVCERGIVN